MEFIQTEHPFFIERKGNFLRKSVVSATSRGVSRRAPKIDDGFKDRRRFMREDIVVAESISKRMLPRDNEFTGRKSDRNFRDLTSLPTNPDEFLRPLEPAKWKKRSRKCSRFIGPVPYFLI